MNKPLLVSIIVNYFINCIRHSLRSQCFAKHNLNAPYAFIIQLNKWFMVVKVNDGEKARQVVIPVNIKSNS